MVQRVAFAFALLLCVHATLAQPEGWYEPCPPATLSVNIRHVFAPKPNEMIVLGQSGIHRTTDGGLSWQDACQGEYYGYANYYDAHFFDANNGIAVGSAVVKTTDAGATWSLVAVPSTPMYGVHFVSPTTGWAVTSKEILKTTDSGLTWASQFKETGLKFFEDIVFFNANTGVAIGGPSHALRTTDAGQTWTPVDFGTTVWPKRLSAVSPTVGYASGMSALYISVSTDSWGQVSVSTNGVKSSVWKTTDAGATWDQQVFTEPSWLRGVHFINEQTGWITGDAGLLGMTTDSGTTWQKFDLGTSQALYGVAFNGSNGLVGGANATVFASNDGGASWLKPRNTGTKSRVDGLYFFDEELGFAVADTSLLRTKDGGQSWQLLGLTVSSSLSPPAICFWNREKGWLANGKVARTTDGGLTWQTDWSQNARGVHFISSTTGWIVGYNGLIAKTTQSGNFGSWVTQESGTTNRLASVWFVDEQTGWAAGEKGTILKTTDSGAHWVPQGPASYPGDYSPPDFTQVRFLDLKVGWVASYNRMLRTADGGETWQIVRTDEYTHWLDGRTGWALPFSGDDPLTRTDDGGLTWRTDEEFGARKIYPQCVHFVNNRVGWVGASDGRILKTVSGGAGYKLYFPWLRADSSNYTGIGIANPNDSAATVSLEAFSPAGAPLYQPPTAVPLTAHQQTAQQGTEFFPVPAGAEQRGWVELTSDVYVGGLFQFGGSSELDGSLPVSGSPPGFRYFTRVYQGPTAFRGRPARTLITVVNPGSKTVDCWLSLYSGNQSFASSEATRSIPAHGQITETVADLFGQNASGGLIQVVGDGLIGFAKIELTSDGTAIGLNAQGPEVSKFLYSGQMAEVQGLFTSIKLVNGSYDARVVQLTAIDNQGGVIAGPVEKTIAGRQALEADAREVFNLTSDAIGTLKVEVDVPGAILGDVIFGDSTSFTYAAGLPLQAQPFREALFNHIAEGLGFFTGLALYVPGSKSADVTISVFAPDGNLKGTTTVPMGAGSRLSKTVSEFIPSALGQIGGYIRISSTEPLVAQELFGYPQLMSAVPPVVLQ